MLFGCSVDKKRRLKLGYLLRDERLSCAALECVDGKVAVGLWEEYSKKGN